MKSWHDFLDKQRNATREVHIGLVGKYDLQDAYKSIRESLNLAATYNDVKAKLHFVNSEDITRENVAEKLQGLAGIIICPGFGSRGIEGKIVAAEFTRTHDIPTFGICLGMQMIVIEFARNVLGYKDANSAEFSGGLGNSSFSGLGINETSPNDQTTKRPNDQSPKQPTYVIDLMEEQKKVTQMGGTMRLGAYECELKEGSKTAQAYTAVNAQISKLKTQNSNHLSPLTISERHRHRYEFNNAYLQEYEQHGMKCVGINPAANLVEIVEIPDKRWYIGTQFHPEYSSTVLQPHPLFMSFVKECAE